MELKDNACSIQPAKSGDCIISYRREKANEKKFRNTNHTTNQSQQTDHMNARHTCTKH